jgi:predicted dehydrogenase
MRICLIGYGYWGKNLARVFGKDLVGICDNDQDNLDKAKKLYDVQYFSNKDELYQSDLEYDTVAIATKADTHFELATTFLIAGKNIWLEKPACIKTKDIEYLIKIRRDNKVFVDHTFVYHPAIQKIKTLDIGTPLYYDSHRISLGLFQKDIDAILDLAIHDLSILDYLYPDLVLDKKSIIKNNHINDKANQSILNLKFTNNFTATINVNWVSPVKKREIILSGSNSSVIFDDISVEKVKVYDTGEIGDDYNINSVKGYRNIEIPDMIEALAQGYEEFKNSVKEDRQPLTSLEKSLKIQSWVNQW